MDRWKAEHGRGREKRKIRREKSRRERVRRKKMQMREKVGKSRNTVFFQWFGAPEGRKVGSLKRRVRSQLGRWEMKNCTPLWRETHVQVKMYKTHQLRTTFGSCDVEKVHAVVAQSTCRSQMLKARGVRTTFGGCDVEKVYGVVARSTFRSQNVQNTPCTDHFWKLRCRKSARRCGAKHIFKSTCTKHTILGPLLEVEMLKKCTPLWREAHFQAKMYKTHHVRTIFGGSDVEKVHAVVARSTFPSQNVQSTPCTDHFWRFRCRKSARRCGAKHISKSKCTKHTMYGPFLEVQMSKKCTPLWREAHVQVKMYKTHHVRTIYGGSDVVSRSRGKGLWTLSKVRKKTWGLCSIFKHNHHHTTLHDTPIHYITLHYNYNYNYNYTFTTFYYTPLHYTALNYTQLHYITLHYLPLHYITLHHTPLHYTDR